jgi:hypothetical protein
MPDYLASIGSYYLNRRDLAGLLADIKIRGPIYIDASLGQINAPLSIVRKALEKLIAHCDYLV